MKPGLHEISEEEYHADPCDEPSLSASIAKTLWLKTPAHAWLEHPRLNPAHEEKHDKSFDLGSAAHKLLLEGDKAGIVEISADSYRTKAAKEERDLAYSAGKIPLLSHQYDQVQWMTRAAKRFLDSTEIAGILERGKPEVTAIAQHPSTGAWFRGRFDLLSDDRLIILDYKTTVTAHPDVFTKHIISMGYDIQAAFYLLLNRLTGGPEDAKFVFLAQETESPYECSLVGVAPSMLEIAAQKVEHCINLWADCLKADNWPGYDTRIHWAESPAWDQQRVLEKVINETEAETPPFME